MGKKYTDAVLDMVVPILTGNAIPLVHEPTGPHGQFTVKGTPVGSVDTLIKETIKTLGYDGIIPNNKAVYTVTNNGDGTSTVVFEL